MLLLTICFPLLAWLFAASGRELRESVLCAAAVCGIIILALTELFSQFQALTPGVVRASWLLIALAICALIYRTPSRSIQVSNIPWRALAPAFGILTVTLVIAIAAQPNNWDSMTYHLARVANWAANQSIAPYPTHITRQVSLNPWAEYAILHLNLLSDGTDRWANLVQWGAFAGSGLAVSGILARLNFDRRVQVLGAVIVYTTPMLILQSTSTQNDLTGAFWIACFVYFSLRLDRDWIFAALCLGLAYSTKATALIVAPAFLLGAWLSDIRISGFGNAFRRAALVVLVAVVANAGYFARNQQVFHDVLGDPAITRSVRMQAHDPLHVTSNVIRNISLHLGTPVGRVTWGLERGIVRAHEIFGLDASDERTTWGTFHVPGTSNHEDNAGNFILVCFTIGAVVAALVKRKQHPALWSYAWQLSLGFLLFCIALKWQPWHSRLHVSFFTLAAVLVAGGISLGARRQRSFTLVTALLVVASVPWLLFGLTRPLVPMPLIAAMPQPAAGTWQSVVRPWAASFSVLTASREDQLFTNMPEEKRPYQEGVARAVAGGCRSVGLVLAGDAREYPVHFYSRDTSPRVRITHVFVSNVTRSLQVADPDVCSILVIQRLTGDEENRTSIPPSSGFQKVWDGGVVSLYKKGA